MKQFIVLIATVLLGLALAVTITNLKSNAETISESVTSKMITTLSSTEYGK